MSGLVALIAERPLLVVGAGFTVLGLGLAALVFIPAAVGAAEYEELELVVSPW